MPLLLYDNFERRMREFTPLAGNEVGLYTCGPTVYDYQHIGNLRTYLFEDLLKRVLALNGYAVRHVMNITDVGHLTSDADTGEDKMEKGSRRTGKSAWQIAEEYTQVFREDLAALNITEPGTWCKATDHIPEQIAFIADIEKNGFAYRTSDGIYFDTAKQPDYGYLARLDKAGLEAGKRIDVGEKRSATDFALWKFSAPDEHRQMEWDSPWGRGFPGWHIECSAMAQKYLGEYFDIHCGGEDHIPVHHTDRARPAAAHSLRARCARRAGSVAARALPRHGQRRPAVPKGDGAGFGDAEIFAAGRGEERDAAGIRSLPRLAAGRMGAEGRGDSRRNRAACARASGSEAGAELGGVRPAARRDRGARLCRRGWGRDVSGAEEGGRLKTLSDAEIAAGLTYIRGSWGNAAEPVSQLEVMRYRLWRE